MKHKHLQPILLACQFLTSIPIHGEDHIAESDIGRSMLWYPFVGLLIGTILVVFITVFAPVLPTLLVATLVVSIWAIITGALHLDGLADSADAWIGGFGDKERTLTLMKDPTCGPIGVVTLVMILMLKVTAIYALLDASVNVWLIILPLLYGRLGILLIFLTTPYVRAGGLAEILTNYFSRSNAWRVLALLTLVSIVIMPWAALCVLLTCLVTFYLMRRQMMVRIDGCTGDTVGAVVEILEVVSLITLTAII